MSIKLGRKWWPKAAIAVAASALALSSAPLAYADGEEGGGHGGHEGGGDACTFFLDHMWANEDGIPLVGSPAHFNEHHTDPAYDNLVLSLASGAIGNSNMPVIDVYGGPLGWIPVFNPSHVKGHGTDYVTLLTSCGGVGIPLDSNDLTSLDVGSVEELANLSDLIMPGLPSPDMLTDPTYLWKTTDASDILDRVTPETLLDVDQYVGFAGDHVDTWRLLWETALNDVSTGNPSGILDVLEITNNINTLESLTGPLGGDTSSDLLGEGGVSDLLGGSGAPDLLGGGDPTELLGDEGVGGLLGEDATSGLLSGDSITGLLGDDADSGLLGGGDPVSGLLGGGDPLSGLLGGGADGGTVDAEKFSSVMSGAADSAAGVGQCQSSLNGNVLALTCVYADMPAEVTEVSVDTGDGIEQLETTGGTSGGAVGSLELTDGQVAALKEGTFELTVSTSGSDSEAISGVIEPC
ncbi:hypothetical protein [Brachybacterium sp. FME24]|uniref:hypothetical protein n=1 Tax=Brachybacterium sp. FME24 TaxID=2742605 RepID=UPI001865D25F|nr:hypothetical protein [Brachybacterium sp. FME24]